MRDGKWKDPDPDADLLLLDAPSDVITPTRPTRRSCDLNPTNPEILINFEILNPTNPEILRLRS